MLNVLSEIHRAWYGVYPASGVRSPIYGAVAGARCERHLTSAAFDTVYCRSCNSTPPIRLLPYVSVITYISITHLKYPSSVHDWFRSYTYAAYTQFNDTIVKYGRAFDKYPQCWCALSSFDLIVDMLVMTLDY